MPVVANGVLAGRDAKAVLLGHATQLRGHLCLEAGGEGDRLYAAGAEGVLGPLSQGPAHACGVDAAAADAAKFQHASDGVLLLGKGSTGQFDQACASQGPVLRVRDRILFLPEP